MKESKLHETIATRKVSRLLRCQKTHRYFTGEGWSPDAFQAKPFSNELDAVREFVQRKMQNVDLVLRFPGSQTDLFCTPIG